MNTKYYIDNAGNFLGGFSGDTGKVPVGSIEVPSAPKDARCIWNGSSWNDPILTVDEKEVDLGVTLEAKVEALLKAVGYADSTLLDDLKVKIDQAKV